MENNQTRDRNSSTPPSRRKHKKLFIIAGITAVILIIVGFVFFSNTKINNSTVNQAQNTPANTMTKNTDNDNTNVQARNQNAFPDLIYGVWSGDSSVIKSYNFASGDTRTLAELPQNIKKVSILTPNTLIYIDQTNDRDHGSRISTYNTQNKQSRILFTASAGYGIDDYVLSQNKKYISTWEVAFAPNSSALAGGKSRLFVTNIDQPDKKNMLYDETADKPVHYPRMVMDNGSVLSDTFMPNDPVGGTGWAYGMSLTNFDGTEKRNLDQMKAGTYGTQPEPTLDGNYLVFAGYDGKNGPGDAVVNGYRQSILTPNTIELLDTKTFTRSKIALFNNEDIYSTASVDKSTGQILVTAISKNMNNMGLYRYDIAKQTKTKVDLEATNITGLTLVSLMPDNQLLLASTQDAGISISNLGENYAPNLLQLYKFADGKTEILKLPDTIMQFITLAPAGNDLVLGINDRDVLSETAAPTNTMYFDQNSNKNKESLQLHSFFVKLNLGQSRLSQQSDNTELDEATRKLFGTDRETGTRCRDLAAAQCTAQGYQPDTTEFKQCQIRTMVTIKTSSMNNGAGSPGGTSAVCYDSPLYLYGPNGKQVEVNINTPVYNSYPEYKDSYKITLHNNNLLINGKSYESIKYDYIPKTNIRPDLSSGKIVSAKEVKDVLRDYSAKLGLNEKETKDLLSYAEQKITKPFVFVSFYPHELSSEILPISFIPQPDNYLNIIFYFKQFDKYPFINVSDPVFPSPLDRSGFTAVEISGVVE